MQRYKGTLFQLMQALKDLSKRPEGITLEDMPFPLRECFSMFMIGRTAEGGPGETPRYHQQDVEYFYVRCMYQDGLPYTLKIQDAEQGLLMEGLETVPVNQVGKSFDAKIQKVRNFILVTAGTFDTDRLAKWLMMTPDELVAFIETAAYNNRHVSPILSFGYKFGALDRSGAMKQLDVLPLNAVARIDVAHYEADELYQQYMKKQAVEAMADHIVKADAVTFEIIPSGRGLGELRARIIIIKPE